MKHFKTALVMTLLFVVFTGFGFPALMYVIGRAFPNQADGSLITVNGKVIGSELIGQQFSKPEYFHPRPSAAGSGYDANNSGGTNLGPTSDKLINGVHDPKNPSGDFDGVKDLAIKYRQENGLGPNEVVPSDAVTRSASGLDPAISVDNADLQAKRVASERKVSLERVKQLIAQSTDEPFLGIFGAPSVNVLNLNLALDRK